MPAPSSSMKAKWAAKCIFRFGIFSGMKVFAKLNRSRGTTRVRLPGHPAPLTLRGGMTDANTFVKIFLDQEYNLDHPGFDPKLVIDAGANVGYASVFFANKYPDARILALEPERTNYQAMLENIKPYRQVEPIFSALWGKPTLLTLTNPDEENWSFQYRESEGNDGADRGADRGADNHAGSVRALTIPDVLSLAGGSHIDLLKLDIEGAEKELFELDYRAWLGHVSTIVIELHDRYKPGCSRAFYHALIEYDFGQYPLGENIVVVMNPARSAARK